MAPSQTRPCWCATGATAPASPACRWRCTATLSVPSTLALLRCPPCLDPADSQGLELLSGGPPHALLGRQHPPLHRLEGEHRGEPLVRSRLPGRRRHHLCPVSSESGALVCCHQAAPWVHGGQKWSNRLLLQGLRQLSFSAPDFTKACAQPAAPGPLLSACSNLDCSQLGGKLKGPLVSQLTWYSSLQRLQIRNCGGWPCCALCMLR